MRNNKKRMIKEKRIIIIVLLSMSVFLFSSIGFSSRVLNNSSISLSIIDIASGDWVKLMKQIPANTQLKNGDYYGEQTVAISDTQTLTLIHQVSINEQGQKLEMVAIKGAVDIISKGIVGAISKLMMDYGCLKVDSILNSGDIMYRFWVNFSNPTIRAVVIVSIVDIKQDIYQVAVLVPGGI